MKLTDVLQDLLFTPDCLFCRKYLGYGTRPLICHGCAEKYSAFKGRCSRCGSELAYENGLPVCHTCKTARYSFDGVVSAYYYKEGVRQAIIEHKFDFYHNNAKTLSYRIADIIGGLFKEKRADYIIPVPPDKKRLNSRGYDPTWEICEIIGKSVDLPLLTDVLLKTKSTPNQSLMSYNARLKNIKGCFEVSDKTAIKGKNIILFDDVFTTGSTCQECSKILKKSGAAYVFAATVSISDIFRK